MYGLQYSDHCIGNQVSKQLQCHNRHQFTIVNLRYLAGSVQLIARLNDSVTVGCLKKQLANWTQWDKTRTIFILSLGLFF